MTKLLVLGGGKIGHAIVEILAPTGDYELTAADQNPKVLEGMPASVMRRSADARDAAALRELVDGSDVVVNACPFDVSVGIAHAALEAGAHYFDLTEDVGTAREIRALGEQADTLVAPQCGVAPGFVSIAAYDLVRRFERVHRVRARVGALPLFPANALKYNLTWSTAGLINEYCNPCEVIHEGKLREVLPLEGLEEFSLDGVTYEAFNTSGGLGTLCDTLLGKVTELSYKTIRHPGHCELARFLCADLQLCNRRPLFQDVLENAIPMTTQDLVLIFISVTGERNGQLVQETFSKKIYHGMIAQKPFSAIQIVTAAAVCAVVDMHRGGTLRPHGVLRLEDVPLADFLDNRFGRYYGP